MSVNIKKQMQITPKRHTEVSSDGVGSFTYIFINEIPIELRDAFILFMHGQTMPFIEGAVYSCDYINFLNKILGRPYFVD